ncbi:MAG: TolC family protein, partial [Planctomycetaceae bacterium]
GGVVNNAPTAAGSGGPARMFVDMSLADAIFAPRAARQLLVARQAGQIATFNDTLLAASLAYTELVRAQDARALADKNLKLANKLLKLTESFEKSGKGTKADVARVEVEVARRRQDIVQADLAIRVASAELARLLRIDMENAGSAVRLAAKDTSLLAVDLVSPGVPLKDLIARAVASRPEIGEADAKMFAARANSNAEMWRPLIPNLHFGVSSGAFGGGLNDDLSQLDGRADIDILAVWQVRNLGLGTAAARRRAESRLRQANLNRGLTRDRVVADVATAYAQVQAAGEQMKIAATRVERAEDSYRKNEARIRSLQGLPLEALQSVTAVIEARRGRLAAAAAYNRAQLRLLRAAGRAISAESPTETERAPE